jgi:hypothetical protein
MPETGKICFLQKIFGQNLIETKMDELVVGSIILWRTGKKKKK